SDAGPQESVSGPYVLSLLLGLLLTWRWLVPVEGVISGETLWISQFSMLLPLMCAVYFWRNRGSGIVWGGLDSCLWLIVIGHWCSLLWMLKSGGDLRAALNVCWEWIAVGVTFFGLRQAVRSQGDRSDLLRLVLMVGVMFAGIGLWQHFVSYRSVLHDYGQLRQSYDELLSKAETTGLSRPEQDEWRQIQLEFQELQIPVEGAALEMFERRLRDNRQPIARWALTNSLGGLLAVVFVLLAGTISGRKTPWFVWLALVVVGLCLWETRSRTAQLATLVGLSLLIIEHGVAESRRRKQFRAGFLVAVVLLGFAGVMWGLQGLDEVRADAHYALRSLQFRL
ncbi:MAG: hypothetical protein N2C12_03860, partial [Planctomycetales bacterium]